MLNSPRLPRAGASAARRRALLAALPCALLCGCGSGGGAQTAHRSCPQAVVYDLSRVLDRVYREGVASERTVVARRMIAASTGLRAAVEARDPHAASAAARALTASGKLTNLLVRAGGRTLASAGGAAMAPLAGTITDRSRRPAGEYLTSVWTDAGFLVESQAISESRVSLRQGTRSLGGSLRLPARGLGPAGEIVLHGRRYQYASIDGESFPAGPIRIYLLRSRSSIARLCGATEADTTVHVLARIAHLIYDGEAGARTLPQVRRVQSDVPLLEAVARREPAAARAAIRRLLNQHIVRLRVNAGGRLLADVGGPDVLAPVSAPLRLAGRRIGGFVLSIQDDEGYLRLTRRLAGLRVLMYARGRLVKNSLGPEPGAVPPSGPYSYRGRSFRVVTVRGTAFPAGPLTIRVLIPIPYS